MNKSYIQYIREMVGDKMIMLNATAVVIVNEANQVLLQKRSDNLMWGLPGGLLEMDESITEGAIREVKEETNLDIEIEKFIGVFINPMMVWRISDKAKVFAYGFLGRVVSGDLRINDDESLEFRYFDEDKLPKIHSADNYDIIKAYYANRFNLVEGNDFNGNG
ncbi:MAG: NUDIX domain-containing protein [Tenericutes bacterium]|nr:NUDIX domain-containing protein [Mycoplasmatota bacterium]